VLAYAQSNPVFPHDSTADQGFDVGQFDSYQALGRHIGLAAVAERRRLSKKEAGPADVARGATDAVRGSGRDPYANA